MNQRKQSERQSNVSFPTSSATSEPHLNDIIQRLLEHESAFQKFLRRRNKVSSVPFKATIPFEMMKV